jgi:phosphoribosylglycinamide formyltransferase-1
MRVAVLVSGSGTNLQALLDAQRAKTLGAKVAVVISNKPGVAALDRAAQAGVPTVVISHKDYGSREGFDAALAAAVRAWSADLVVLAGFMRLLTPTFLNDFPGRVINIHPSLLPAFPGVDAQAQAWHYGVKVTGCTVHFVDAGTDTGPIIAQSSVAVHDDDTVDTLRARILAEEHQLLPRVVSLFAQGRVRAEGRRVKIVT